MKRIESNQINTAVTIIATPTGTATATTTATTCTIRTRKHNIDGIVDDKNTDDDATKQGK